MVEGVQFRSVTPSVQRRHIISTDEVVWYGSVTSSVLTMACSTSLPKLLRGDGDGCIYLGEGSCTDKSTTTCISFLMKSLQYANMHVTNFKLQKSNLLKRLYTCSNTVWSLKGKLRYQVIPSHGNP